MGSLARLLVLVRSGLLAFVLLAACGPSRTWVGRTPDRRHTVEVIEDAGLRYVVVDGQRRAAYRGIAESSIAFSERGHMAFKAQVGRDWVAILDGVAGERWSAIGTLVLSATGRLAYGAARAGGWYVVVDDRPGPRFDAIRADTLRFSADGRRVAYAGEVGGRVHVVTDGRLGPAFDGVDGLVMSPDGERVAYGARRGVDAFAVVGEELGPRWSQIGKLVVSAAGGRVAFAGLDREGWRVVVDGEVGAKVDAVRHLVFRDDARHVAWLARVGQRDSLFVDGEQVAAWSAIRTSGVAFRPGGAPGEGRGLAHVEPVERSFASTFISRGERVVVDGVAGTTYDEVGTPIWSRDGRLAYAARRHDAWLLVVDGRELTGGDSVGEPIFSPDGRRLGCLVRRGAATLVVVDGHDHRFEVAIEGSLAFSADSRRWAVIAGDAAGEQAFFSIDGARRVSIPAAEIHAAVPSRGPATLFDLREADHRLLQAWSRAEAERAGP